MGHDALTGRGGPLTRAGTIWGLPPWPGRRSGTGRGCDLRDWPLPWRPIIGFNASGRSGRERPCTARPQPMHGTADVGER